MSAPKSSKGPDDLPGFTPAFGASPVYFQKVSQTLLELSDLTEPPKVKIDLPPMRVGDRLRLRFTLQRRHLGRHEVLEVQGEFKVVSHIVDTTKSSTCQIVQVASMGKSPAWRAVKAPPARKLAPARSPRTTVT